MKVLPNDGIHKRLPEVGNDVPREVSQQSPERTVPTNRMGRTR